MLLLVGGSSDSRHTAATEELPIIGLKPSPCAMPISKKGPWRGVVEDGEMMAVEGKGLILVLLRTPRWTVPSLSNCRSR